jgi:putative transposase
MSEKNPVVVRVERGSRGTSGVFSYLLEHQPALTAWLASQVERRKVMLEQIHTDGMMRTRISGLIAVHNKFLRQCRSAGSTAPIIPSIPRQGAPSIVEASQGRDVRNFDGRACG